MGMGEVLDLSHDTPLIMVGEYHGNPGSIVFYDAKGFCVLSLHISLLSAQSSYSKYPVAIPSIKGDSELVSLISNVLFPDSSEISSGQLLLEISGDRMDFKEHEKLLFSLRIKSHMIYEDDTDCS